MLERSWQVGLLLCHLNQFIPDDFVVFSPQNASPEISYPSSFGSTDQRLQSFLSVACVLSDPQGFCGK